MFVNYVLFGLSKLSDRIEGNDTFHQRRVAIIAYEIAKQLGFDDYSLNLVVEAALIHDIALNTDTSKVETFRQIVYEDFEKLNKHAVVSGKVARFFNLHLDVTTAISMHHTPSAENYSILGNVLFLADNVEVAYRGLTNPYAFDELYDFVAQKSRLFSVDMLRAFEMVSRKTCFWYDLLQENVDRKVGRILEVLPKEKASSRFFKAVAYLLAYFSDKISVFFSGNSVLVKNIATSVGYKLDLDVNRLFFAALLAHVGNLTVPFDVFNLPELDNETFNIIKAHTYEARNILEELGVSDIARIVFSHHENNLGTGYPCGAKPDKETQVLGLASVLTAMMQDRPYREALSKGEILDELSKIRNEKLYSEEIVDEFMNVDVDKIKKSSDEYYMAVTKIFS